GACCRHSPESVQQQQAFGDQTRLHATCLTDPTTTPRYYSTGLPVELATSYYSTTFSASLRTCLKG
ncbi:hypothetical protein Hamer_G027412, partial [Homarus americanus]